MQLKKPISIASTLCILACTCISARGVSLTYFADRSSFNNAFPGIAVEDFEAGRVTGAGGDVLDAPLSSSSSGSVFHAGEILPGMVFQDNPGPTVPGGLFLNRAGYCDLPSQALSANDYNHSLDIYFTEPAAAARLDLFAVDGVTRNVNYTLSVSVYGDSGFLGARNLSARSDGQAVFFGVSATEPITRVNIDSSMDIAEFVDNVGFAAVPEPSAMLVLGAGLMVLVIGRIARGGSRKNF